METSVCPRIYVKCLLLLCGLYYTIWLFFGRCATSFGFEVHAQRIRGQRNHESQFVGSANSLMSKYPLGLDMDLLT